MLTIKAQELKKIVISIFIGAGASKSTASRVADNLVGANLVGIDSHGIIRIPQYLKWIKDGTIDLNAKMELVEDKSIMALIDGHHSFGQIVVYEACNIAIDKAKENGMSLITIRNTSHIGRLGEYAEKITSENLISIVMVNAQGAGQLVAPWGAKERRLSANPIAWGIPTGRKEEPIILDISTSIVAEGKIILYKNLGKKLPEGWVIDSMGNPTTNPNDLYGPPEGSILPMSGHKGYGLSMVIDILTGALSGGGCSRKGVKNFYNAVTLISIDPNQICPIKNFSESVDQFIEYVKSSSPIIKGKAVLIPNELENEVRKERLSGGIVIEEKIWDSISQAARDVEVNTDQIHSSQ